MRCPLLKTETKVATEVILGFIKTFIISSWILVDPPELIWVQCAVKPYSMVRVASFGQILFFSTLERGAFLHTFLQLYTKYTLIIGSFTKKYIFGLFSENFHYFSNYGKKFMIFSQYTLSSSSCKSHLGKPTDKSWGCFEIILNRSFHSCKLHNL